MVNKISKAKAFFKKKAILKVNEDGLFCIVDSNLKEALSYLDRDVIDNATYFESMKTRHKAFLWPSSHMEKQRQKKANSSESQHYKAGDPILTLSNDDQ